MPVSAENPFAEIEAMLRDPGADGIFMTYLRPESELAKAGVVVGDIVVAVGDQPTADERTYYKALQPRDEKDSKRVLNVLRGGRKMQIEVGVNLTGYDSCAVAKGRSAWDEKPDFEEEPDFSAFDKGVDSWMRNSFGEEPAGFEHISIRRKGGAIEAVVDFRLGGDSEPGKKWDYFTRAVTVHKLDKHLSVTRTAFWEGRPERLRGDVTLGDDRIWRGVQGKGDSEAKVEYPANAPSILTGYTSALLPLIMPLRAGASLTFFLSSDASGTAKGRSRFECTGRKNVTVSGKEVPAWGFAWRHYGNRKPEDDECFYLDDDREFVRIDWGPGYGNCWCEKLDKERTLATIPKHIL